MMQQLTCGTGLHNQTGYRVDLHTAETAAAAAPLRSADAKRLPQWPLFMRPPHASAATCVVWGMVQSAAVHAGPGRGEWRAPCRPGTARWGRSARAAGAAAKASRRPASWRAWAPSRCRRRCPPASAASACCSSGSSPHCPSCGVSHEERSAAAHSASTVQRSRLQVGAAAGKAGAAPAGQQFGDHCPPVAVLLVRLHRSQGALLVSTGKRGQSGPPGPQLGPGCRPDGLRMTK